MCLIIVLQYAVESQVRWHGYDPATSVIIAKPREVSCTCTVLVSKVLYYSLSLVPFPLYLSFSSHN